MTFPPQKSFGEFIAERYGPKWVYAQRASDRLKSRYPDSVVITPKQQRQLAADYKREWGAEYDKASWQALCALRSARRCLAFYGSTALDEVNLAHTLYGDGYALKHRWL